MSLCSLSRGSELLAGYLKRGDRTQAALAKDVGVQSGLVNKWLHGRQKPSLAFALKLLAICEIPLDAWQKPQKSVARRRVA